MWWVGTKPETDGLKRSLYSNFFSSFFLLFCYHITSRSREAWEKGIRGGGKGKHAAGRVQDHAVLCAIQSHGWFHEQTHNDNPGQEAIIDCNLKQSDERLTVGVTSGQD